MYRIATASLFFVFSMGSAAAMSIVDLGTVEVEIQFDRDERCNIGVDAELCLAGWETKETVSPADDTLSVNQSVDRVVVRAGPSLVGPPQDFAFQPSDLSIGHPGFSLLNETWQAANASLPGVHGLVWLESAEHASTDVAPASWGLAITREPNTPGSSRVWILCWDLSCSTIWWGYIHSSESHIAILPDNHVTQPWDSDAWFEHDFAGDQEGVLTCRPIYRDVVCPESEFSRGRPLASEGVQILESLAPRIMTFVAVNSTRVVVGTDSNLTGFQSKESDGTPFDLLEANSHESETVALKGDPRPPLSPTEPVVDAATTGKWSTGQATSSLRTVPASFGQRLSPAVVVAGGFLFFAALLIGLYARLRGDRILEHSTRRAIFEAICSEPGVLVGTLASHLGIAHQAVKHHVQVLESFGLVKTLGVNRKRILPVGRLTPTQEQRCIGVLSNQSARRVFEVLERAGPLDLATLARESNLAYSTTAGLVSMLKSAGLVGGQRIRRRLYVHPVAPKSSASGTPLQA